MNAIIGLDEMILRESNEKNIRTYAADIMSAGRTLLSLINDILDLSRVESGRQHLNDKHINIRTAIDERMETTPRTRCTVRYVLICDILKASMIGRLN